MLHILERGEKIIFLTWLNFVILSTWPNLPVGVTFRPPLRCLPIFGILELQIKRGRTCWKANISYYNAYEVRYLRLCLYPCQFLGAS
jgi:hypothetical protein